jgi:hypothetical protein
MHSRLVVKAASAAGLWLCLGSGALANIANLTPSKDNTLFEDPMGMLSNGAGPHIYAGQTNINLLRRGLIAFDIAGNIPAGSKINSVSLAVQCSQVAPGEGVNPRSHGLHAASQDWGEGTSNSGSPGGGGAPATTGDATWTHTFYSTSPWTSPGGDYAATPSATLMVAGAGAYAWSSTAMLVSDVQGWLDTPASNFGWVIIGEESIFGTARRFDSRESLNMPVLTIDYTPPPTFYCTGKTTSDGCVPFLTFDGFPSATSGAFNLYSNDHVEGQIGFFLYSLAKGNLDFHGGKLCVKAPISRLQSLIKSTDGIACTTCAGNCRMFKRNFNQLIQSGSNPLLTAGQSIAAQGRQRDPTDPAGFGDNLSNGIRFVIGP